MRPFFLLGRILQSGHRAVKSGKRVLFIETWKESHQAKYAKYISYFFLQQESGSPIFTNAQHNFFSEHFGIGFLIYYGLLQLNFNV